MAIFAISIFSLIIIIIFKDNAIRFQFSNNFFHRFSTHVTNFHHFTFSFLCKITNSVNSSTF